MTDKNALFALVGVMTLKYGTGSLIISPTGTLTKRTLTIDEDELKDVKNVNINKRDGKLIITADGNVASRQ